jgi:very-short-patch-repair endonuclease
MDKTQTFILKAIKVHGDRYDYSKVNYINAKTKIIIVCKIHGEFIQTPSNHLHKFNCQKCANNFKSNTKSFIEKAIKIHGDRYDYSKVNYINADTHIIIICKEHGEFMQIPDFHINRKCGCGKCSNNVKLDTKTFIEKATKTHKGKYDYSHVNYINSITPVQIFCKKHGEFRQTPDIHINQKGGCPSCINKTEFKFYDKMKDEYPTIKRQYKVEWCKNKLYLPYDFVIEELKIIIEIDGIQHFKQVSNWKSPEIQIERDQFKMKCANENGFSVIRLIQTDILRDTFNWIDEIKSTIIKIINENRIQNIFMCKNNEYDIFIKKLPCLDLNLSS